MPRAEIEERTIVELQTQQASGHSSARQHVEAYLERIAALDRSGPTLRTVLEINPDALEIADALDRERAKRGPRGPLHGIPILLKDNIDTADAMHTTAGSQALLDSRVAQDATVARKLREAGAVLLGKANLSEWANFRSTRSSSGWSGRGRQTRNPYVLDRSPGGSSSGSGAAVAANLAAAALGTETDGSIMSPSSNNCVVGIKPTVGLTSRAGVIPISHSQDSVGPHGRTVADVAAVLSAIAGGVDVRDPATASVPGAMDYTKFLDRAGLAGARLGIARKFHTGYHEHTDLVFEQAVECLRAAGAELIEDVEIPGEGRLRKPFEDDEDITSEGLVLQFEFKANLATYLASRPDACIKNVDDLIRFNDEHAAEEMPYFRQERLLSCAQRGPLADELYQRAAQHNRAFANEFAAFMDEQHLDAIVAPTNQPAWAIDTIGGDHILGASSTPTAVAGFPLITVPAGFAHEALPIGLTFMGTRWSEPTLIKLAYAFEQAHPVRRAPTFVPTLLHLP